MWSAFWSAFLAFVGKWTRGLIVDIVRDRRSAKAHEELGALKQKSAGEAEQRKTLDAVDDAANRVRNMTEEEKKRRALE